MGERNDLTATSKLLGCRLDDLTEVQLRAMLETTFVYEKRVQIRGALRQLKKKKAESSEATRKPTVSTPRRLSKQTSQVEEKVSKKPPDVKCRTKSSSSALKYVSGEGQRVGTSKNNSTKEGKMETTYQRDTNGNSSAFLMDSHGVHDVKEVLELNKRRGVLLEKSNGYHSTRKGNGVFGVRVDHTDAEVQEDSGEKDGPKHENGVSYPKDDLNGNIEGMGRKAEDMQAGGRDESVGELISHDGCLRDTLEHEEGRVNGESELCTEGVATSEKRDEEVTQLKGRASPDEIQGPEFPESDQKVKCSQENDESSMAETGGCDMKRKQYMGGKEHVSRVDGVIVVIEDKGKPQFSTVEANMDKMGDILRVEEEEPHSSEVMSANGKAGRLGKAADSDGDRLGSNGTDVGFEEARVLCALHINEPVVDERLEGDHLEEGGSAKQESCSTFQETDPRKELRDAQASLETEEGKEADITLKKVEEISKRKPNTEESRATELNLEKLKECEQSDSRLGTIDFSRTIDEKDGKAAGGTKSSEVILAGSGDVDRDSGIVLSVDERKSLVGKDSRDSPTSGDSDTKSGRTTKNEMTEVGKTVGTKRVEGVGNVGSESIDKGLTERKGKLQQLQTKSDSTDSGINGDAEDATEKLHSGDLGLGVRDCESSGPDQGKAEEKKAVRLEDIEDEAELRRMLDSTFNFDERSEIRAAMRALKKKHQNQPAEKIAPPQLSYLGLAGGTWHSGRNKFVPKTTSTPKTTPTRKTTPPQSGATSTTRSGTKTPETPHTQDKSGKKMPVLDATDAARDVKAHSRHKDFEFARSQQKCVSREDEANLRSLPPGMHSSRERENVEKETIAAGHKIHDCLLKKSDREESPSCRFAESSPGTKPGRGRTDDGQLLDHGLKNSKMCDVERNRALVLPLVDTSTPKDERESAKQRRREWQNDLLRCYSESDFLDEFTTKSKDKVEHDLAHDQDEEISLYIADVEENTNVGETVQNKNIPSTLRKECSLDENDDSTETMEQTSLSLSDLVNGNLQTDSTNKENLSFEIEDFNKPEKTKEIGMPSSSEQLAIDQVKSGSEDESSEGSTDDLTTEIDVSLISTDEEIELHSIEDAQTARYTSEGKDCSVTDISSRTGGREEDLPRSRTSAAAKVASSNHKRVDEGRVGRKAPTSRWEPLRKANFKDIQLQFQKGVEKKSDGRKEDRALRGVRGKVSQAAQLFNSPSAAQTSPERSGLHSPLRTSDRGLPGSPSGLTSPRTHSPTNSSKILSDRRPRVGETGSNKPVDLNSDASDGVVDSKALEGSPSRSMYTTPPATPGSPDTFYTPGEVVAIGAADCDTPKMPESTKRGTSSVVNSQHTKRTKVGGDRAQLGEDTEPPDTMAPTVEQITDETTLEKMLEEATIFEERKKIRARLRELRKQKKEGGGDNPAPNTQQNMDNGDTGGTTVTTERKRTRATALTVNTSSSVEANNNSTVRDIKPSGPQTKAVSPISPAAKTIRTDNHVTSVDEKDDGTTKTMTTTSVKTGPGMKSTQVTSMSKSDDGAGSKSGSMTQETTSTKTETSGDGTKSFSSKTTTSSFSSSSSTDKAAPAGKPQSKFQRELEEKKRIRAEQQKKDQDKWKSEQETRKKSAYEKKKQEAEDAQKKKSSLMDKFGGKASNVGPVGPKRSVAAGGTRMMAQNPASIKAKLLEWSQRCTRGYENVQISNFSGSWCDGMAFCALIHSYYPDGFDFDKLDPKNRRENFDLAFNTAENLADIYPLLETDDMIMMKNKPDWKCVFTYVQALYRGLTKGTGQMP